MNNKDDQVFLIMLTDLVSEKLISSDEAEVAKEYYFKSVRKKSEKPGSKGAA